MNWKFILIGVIASFIGLVLIIESIALPVSVVVTTEIDGVQTSETSYLNPIPALLMLIGGLAFLLTGTVTTIRLGITEKVTH